MEKNSFKQLNDRLDRLTEAVKKYQNGGKGSGNFGHAGRPGERGGSASEGTGGSEKGGQSSAEKVKAGLAKAKERGFQTLEAKDEDLLGVKPSLEANYDRRTSEEKGKYKLNEKIKELKDKLARGETVAVRAKLAKLNAEIDSDVEWDDKTQIRGQKAYDAMSEWDDDDIVAIKLSPSGLTSYKKLKNSMSDKITNGGKGSGNFGHSGRPGEIGGSAPAGYGVSKAERRLAGMGKEASEPSNSNTGISFEGGSPASVLTIDNDHFYRMEEYTGAGSRYDNGTINLAYDNRVNAPFTIDETSNNELQQCWDEEDKIRKQEREVTEEQKVLKSAGKYTYEEHYSWSDKPSIFTVQDYSSADNVMKSTMPQADKEKYAKLEEKKKALSREQVGLRDKETEIRKNAKYYPSETGAKGSILIAGLAKGISNYMGQRSDGAGEGSFNEYTERRLNGQSKIHADFIQAMRYPKAYSDTEFNSLRDASAKLATSQAAYLKRVEKDVGTPFMQASEMSNVAKTIKKLTRDQVVADNATNGTEYVSFKTGSPVIKNKTSGYTAEELAYIFSR